MKVILDTCVWGGAKYPLIEDGYYVIWVGEWEKDPGDKEILTYANKHKRSLITLDKDFGELAIVFEYPHYGILRLVNISARQQAQVCLQILKEFGSELQQGSIITVDQKRVRIHPCNK